MSKMTSRFPPLVELMVLWAFHKAPSGSPADPCRPHSLALPETRLHMVSTLYFSSSPNSHRVRGTAPLHVGIASETPHVHPHPSPVMSESLGLGSGH